MPLVVVALAGQRPPGRQLQIALRPLQGLDRGLLVDAERDGLAGRVDTRPTTSAALEAKSGSLLSHQDLRLLDRSSDCAGSARRIRIDIAKLLRQKRAGPARKAFRRRSQQRQNPLVRLPRVDRLFARARLVLKTSSPSSAKHRRQWLAIRGWTPTSLAIDRVLRPAAAKSTSALASNRAVSSPATGSEPAAHHVPCAKAALLLLRESSRSKITTHCPLKAGPP